MSGATKDKHGRAHTAAWWAKRNASIVARACTPGVTYDDIAAEHGISRQRVKQIVDRALGAAAHDPAGRRWRGRTPREWRDAMRAAVEHPAHVSWRDVALALGVSEPTVRHWRRAWRDIDALGRLRFRRAKELARGRARADIVVAYRAWRALAGRRPTAHECAHAHEHGLPPTLAWANVYKHFGSIAALNAAADNPNFPTEAPYEYGPSRRARARRD